MPHDPNYVPTQFTQKDYRLLYRMAKSGYLRRILAEANCRDKKVQRASDRFILEILRCPLDQIGLHVNEETEWGQDMVKWRLTIAK